MSCNATQDKERSNVTAVDIQQEYFETIGDTDWSLFEVKDRKYLLQKVAIALCGTPSKEGNLKNCVSGSACELQGYEKRETEVCMKVFEKILEQAQYSHNRKNILISILRIVCVIPTRELSFYEPTPNGYWMNLHTKSGSEVNFYVFHVFSLRKCVATKPGVKGCRVFIDHIGRVYKTWDSYLNDNILPKCVMVVPKNGEYKGTPNSSGDNTTPRVKLTVVASPALGPTAKVLSVADTASAVANIGALATAIGAVFVSPVLAPVMVGTAVGVGVVTGVYAIGRSTAQLIDRNQHEQSNSLDDPEARGAWLNIIISSVGLSCSAATKLLSWAARSGTNIVVLMKAVQYLQYTNLATGFLGVGNGLFEMTNKYVKYGELPTGTEIFQFTTSALFLGIGVITNQTAQEIVKDAQAKTINDIRESLASNTKKRIFDKVTAETRRTKGTINGNTEVIKALKTINNKDEFFGQLNRINKQVNQNKMRISLSGDGKMVVNNNFKHSVSSVYELGKEGRNQLFSRYGPANVTSKNAPTRIYPSCTNNSTFVRACREASIFFSPDDMTQVATFLSQLNPRDQDMLVEILSESSEKLHDALLLLSTKLIASLVPAEIKLIMGVFGQMIIPVILFVLRYIEGQLTTVVGKCDYENDNSIVLILKSFIHNGRIDTKAILVLKERLMKIMRDYPKIKDFRDEGNKYDFIFEYRGTYSRRIRTIEAGEEIEAGPHVITITPTTVDKLQEMFEEHSQRTCDQIMDVAFKIISKLSASEILFVNGINLDEDIVIRVAQFLLTQDNFQMAPGSYSEDDMIRNKKSQLLTWRRRQRVRSHEACPNCKGTSYF